MDTDKIITFLVIDDEKPESTISKITLLIIVIIVIFLIVFTPRKKSDGLTQKINKTIEARKQVAQFDSPLKFTPKAEDDLSSILYPSDSLAYHPAEKEPDVPLVLEYDTGSNLNHDQLKNNLKVIQAARTQQYDRSDFSKYGSVYAPMGMLFSEETRYI